MSALAPTTASASAGTFVLPTEPAAIDEAIAKISATFSRILDFDKLTLADLDNPTCVLESTRPHVENLLSIINVAIKNLPENDRKNALMAKATRLSNDTEALLAMFRKHLKA